MSLARSERQQELIELAEFISEDNSDDGAVDLEALLNDKTIGFCVGDYGDSFDGMLEYEDGRFFVYLNKERGNLLHTPKGRFTLGHEIGHYFIDEHREAIMSGLGRHGSKTGLFDGSPFKEEHEADLFAANLLMPPSRFLERLKAGESPLAQIKKQAAFFKSSLTSTALQYVALSPVPTGVISWDAEGTFRWVSLGHEFSRDERRKYWAKTKYEDPSQRPRDCATQEVLDGKAEQSEGVTTASTVFVNVRSGAHRDDIIREECLKLGDYGFLTILSEHPDYRSS